MILPKNGEWHGVCFHVFIHSFHIHHLNVKKEELNNLYTCVLIPPVKCDRDIFMTF